MAYRRAMHMGAFLVLLSELVATVVIVVALYVVARSLIVIGPAQVGLVVKRFSTRHNTTDTPIAFQGEAGYQSELLMPGVRFKLWPTFSVSKYPWVQVPAGEIGVVISQIGDRLPTGAKSAVYRPEFGNFTDLHAFLAHSGQKGVQRPVLPPGHPHSGPPGGVPGDHGDQGVWAADRHAHRRARRAVA